LRRVSGERGRGECGCDDAVHGRVSAFQVSCAGRGSARWFIAVRLGSARLVLGAQCRESQVEADVGVRWVHRVCGGVRCTRRVGWVPAPGRREFNCRGCRAKFEMHVPRRRRLPFTGETDVGAWICDVHWFGSRCADPGGAESLSRVKSRSIMSGGAHQKRIELENVQTVGRARAGGAVKVLCTCRNGRWRRTRAMAVIARMVDNDQASSVVCGTGWRWEKGTRAGLFRVVSSRTARRENGESATAGGGECVPAERLGSRRARAGGGRRGNAGAEGVKGGVCACRGCALNSPCGIQSTLGDLCSGCWQGENSILGGWRKDCAMERYCRSLHDVIRGCPLIG